MRQIRSQFIHHSIGFSVGLFITLVGLVMFDTFLNNDPPFKTENEMGTITFENGFSVFNYNRDLYVLKDFEGTVHRYLSPSNYDYPQYTMPSSTLEYKASKIAYRVERPFAFTPPLRPGIWCIHATMYWRPTFSLTVHNKDANPVCAEAK